MIHVQNKTLPSVMQGGTAMCTYLVYSISYLLMRGGDGFSTGLGLPGSELTDVQLVHLLQINLRG